MPGTLFVVATPIGNLEDVTARALRVLREVSLIAAEDTRRTAHLLARYAIQTPTTSLHEHNEEGKSGALIARLAAGESIALVSDAGTPTVSDPGGRLIAAAIEAGIPIEPIPGPSAVLALLSVAGLPTDSFTFLGFPPLRSHDRNSWFEALSHEVRTVIFFESPHRILQTLQDVRRYLGECSIVVGRELTKVHGEVLRGPVSTVMTALGTPKGEIVVGLHIGQITNLATPGPPGDDVVAAEFGLATENGALSRRRAVTVVARKLGMTPNAVYAAVERRKNRPNDIT